MFLLGYIMGLKPPTSASWDCNSSWNSLTMTWQECRITGCCCYGGAVFQSALLLTEECEDLLKVTGRLT
jgi:hypothetical protein